MFPSLKVVNFLTSTGKKIITKYIGLPTWTTKQNNTTEKIYPRDLCPLQTPYGWESLPTALILKSWIGPGAKSLYCLHSAVWTRGSQGTPNKQTKTWMQLSKRRAIKCERLTTITTMYHQLQPSPLKSSSQNYFLDLYQPILIQLCSCGCNKFCWKAVSCKEDRLIKLTEIKARTKNEVCSSKEIKVTVNPEIQFLKLGHFWPLHKFVTSSNLGCSYTQYGHMMSLYIRSLWKWHSSLQSKSKSGKQTQDRQSSSVTSPEKDSTLDEASRHCEL